MNEKIIANDELEKGQSLNNRHKMKNFVAKNSKRQIDGISFLCRVYS